MVKIKNKKSRYSKVTMLPNKTCNKCGIDTVEYQVFHNGILCKDCLKNYFGIDLEKSIIPNEKNMIKKILNENANQMSLL